MSKAFTKEDAGGDEGLAPYVPPWPPGARNYITPAGLERLREERAAASVEASPEAQRRLQRLDAHLDAAKVVIAPAGTDRVQFGVRVELEDGEGGARRYEIVGVDEVDAARGRVSWLSPIARSLQGARAGDSVVLRSPRGEEELTVCSISPVGG